MMHARIKISVDRDTLKLIDAAAKALGLSRSAFLAGTAVAKARKILATPDDIADPTCSER